jgi:hypothetical protein
MISLKKYKKLTFITFFLPLNRYTWGRDIGPNGGIKMNGIEIKRDGERAIIDVRPNIARGEHPRNQIFDYVKEAPIGTLFEIHLPFRAEPLMNGLSSFGLNEVINEQSPHHFVLRAVKLNVI